jgi:hypothetical protein
MGSAFAPATKPAERQAAPAQGAETDAQKPADDDDEDDY